MVKLNSFTFISLNGYYKGVGDDINWHKHGGEEAQYSAASLKANNTLLFGRVTYEMMAGFWPTPMAHDTFPEVAEGMNKSDKIVVLGSLKSTDWENTSIIPGNLVEEITVIKQTGINNITLLGSGSILAQLAEANLVDEYQLMIDPVLLKEGTRVLNKLRNSIHLKMTKSQIFKSGIILVNYVPV